MIKTKAIRGTVIVLVIISMMGCGNREEQSNKTLVMVQNTVTNVENDFKLVDMQPDKIKLKEGRIYEASTTEGN